MRILDRHTHRLTHTWTDGRTGATHTARRHLMDKIVSRIKAVQSSKEP